MILKNEKSAFDNRDDNDQNSFLVSSLGYHQDGQCDSRCLLFHRCPSLRACERNKKMLYRATKKQNYL
jgi:hypothetical protein